MGRELAMASKSFCTLSCEKSHFKMSLGIDDMMRSSVMKTALVDIYMDFSTTLVPEADKLWKSGDEAYKAEICFEKVEW